jgi:sugar lactone lactonase YvrE
MAKFHHRVLLCFAAQLLAVHSQDMWHHKEITKAWQKPSGLVVDSDGALYVSHYWGKIFQITDNGTRVIAGTDNIGYKDANKATEALFNAPRGLAIDTNGDILIADSGNHAIRRLSKSGVVTTVAGVVRGVVGAGMVNGDISIARFSHPKDVAVDKEGNIYVADTGNGRIRVINVFGAVSTYAGGGSYAGCNSESRTDLHLESPCAVDVDDQGSVYTVNWLNNDICKFATDGQSTSLADSVLLRGHAAPFHHPESLAVSASGDVFVADTRNKAVRRISKQGQVTTIAEGGAHTLSDSDLTRDYDAVWAIAVGPYNEVYVADRQGRSITKLTETRDPKESKSSQASTLGSLNGSTQTSEFQPQNPSLENESDPEQTSTENNIVELSGNAGVAKPLAAIILYCMASSRLFMNLFDCLSDG